MSSILQHADLVWVRAFSGGEYASAIENLLQEFDVGRVPTILQMELVDLQCDRDLKAQFRAQFRAAQGKSDMTGQFMRELPPSSILS